MTAAHRKMSEACKAMREATNGECALEVCEGIGWCSHCFEAAYGEKEARSPGLTGTEQASRAAHEGTPRGAGR